MISGFLDRVEAGVIGGWAFDRQQPDSAVRVRIMLGPAVLAEVTADAVRDDLLRAGVGTGAYGFRFRVTKPMNAEDLPLVTAVAVSGPGDGVTLPRWSKPDTDTAPKEVAAKRDSIRLNFQNMAELLEKPPRQFDWIMFDPNNDCNIHCVYCHNVRSRQNVGEEEFGRLLSTGILGTENFQFGCGMEPTLDPRLADMMLMVAHSPAKPRHHLRLQTNGILLHRHDTGKLREAGLTMLTVSIDTIDTEAFSRLRGGSSLPKVMRNLLAFRAECPDVAVAFITTVTSLNIHTIDQLVSYGLDIGVVDFNIRQMFYFPRSRIVDHTRMPQLVVSDEAFGDMVRGLTEKYGDRARFCIQTSGDMVAESLDVLAASSLSQVRARLMAIADRGQVEAGPAQAAGSGSGFGAA